MPFTIPTFLAINLISKINLFQRVNLLGLSYKAKIIGFSSLFLYSNLENLKNKINFNYFNSNDLLKIALD